MYVKRFGLTLLAAAVLALGALALGATTALAGPAAPGDRVVEQPDGTTVTVRAWGDEWNHGMETAEGYTVMVDEPSGFLVYAEVREDGTLAPALVNGSMLVAGRDDPAPLAPGLRPTPQRPPERRLAPIRQADGPNLQSFQGTMPVLVILGKFNNQDYDHSIPISYWRNMFFSTTQKSIKDFYAQASFGALNLSAANETHNTDNDGVVGWVSLGMNHPDGFLNQITSNAIARSALNAANGSVNFASYDKNHDGYVTSSELQVVIIAAGYEGSFDGYYYRRMWAHQWDLDDNTLRLDGVYVGQNSPAGGYGGYAILGELFDNAIDSNGDGYGDTDAPLQMGTPAHEFGHLLAWPDLYDTDNSSEGVGNWSIMGSGSWNHTDLYGDSPALPDAWLKWYQGWIAPQKPVKGVPTAAARADANPQAYVVGANPNGVDWNFFRSSGQGQYWLVENRQTSGETYDAGLPGCGLLIWHINESVTSNNQANADEDAPLMALEQADGMNHLHISVSPYNRGDENDPWPGNGVTARTAFNDGTNPNARTVEGWLTKFRVSVQASPRCADSMNFLFALEDGEKSYFMPSALRYTPAASGVITDNGAAVNNTEVELMVSPGPGQPYALAGSDRTDSAGRYSIPLPSAGHEMRFFARWRNPSTAYNSRLDSFSCKVVTNWQLDSTCNINIHDVKMVEPAAGATVMHPFKFMWTTRSTTTDSYTVQLFRANQSLLAELPDLGYVDRVTVSSAYPGTSTNTLYYWSMRVDTPDGVGYAFFVRGIKWSDLSGPALSGPEGGALAPWQEGIPALDERTRPEEQ